MVNCQNKENGVLYTFYAGENRKATDTVLSDFLRGMRESSSCNELRHCNNRNYSFRTLIEKRLLSFSRYLLVW